MIVISDIADIYSIAHIVLFFAIGVIVLLLSKKLKYGILSCIIIGIIWEILENQIIGKYVLWFGDSTIYNSIFDIFISDMIGFVLAYLVVKKIERR